jgi:hypothetical protein
MAGEGSPTEEETASTPSAAADNPRRVKTKMVYNNTYKLDMLMFNGHHLLSH